MRLILLIAALCCLSLCEHKAAEEAEDKAVAAGVAQESDITRKRAQDDDIALKLAPHEADRPTTEPSPRTVKSRTALQMDSLGLLNVAEQDSSIVVSLMYARADNFTGRVLYTDLHEAYLHPDAMRCLLKAQQLLKERRPDLTLAVYDAARPMRVQQVMWDAVKGTAQQNYVSNPARGGGMHNYGVAVDITLATLDGDTLPMGTKIDHLGREAHIGDEAAMVRQGKLTQEAWENRQLLRSVMTEAGFKTLPSEWWHFNLMSRNETIKKYRIIK